MARKSKEFGYFLSQQKQSKQRQKQFEILKNKLKQASFDTENFVFEPSGEAKMSEVLQDFVKPYKKFADTEEAMHKLMTLAVMAWNTSLFPEQEQQDMVEKVLDEGIPEATEELKAELKEIVNEFISRKKCYFSAYNRLIVDFELKDIGKGYHLSVASTLDEAPPSSDSSSSIPS